MAKYDKCHVCGHWLPGKRAPLQLRQYVTCLGCAIGDALKPLQNKTNDGGRDE